MLHVRLSCNETRFRVKEMMNGSIGERHGARSKCGDGGGPLRPEGGRVAGALPASFAAG